MVEAPTQPNTTPGSANLAGHAGSPERDERRALDRTEWRTGWPLIVVATLGSAVSTAGFISLGSILHPLQTENGWSRFDITVAGLIIVVATFGLAPFAGKLVDRFGIRPVALASGAVFAVCQATVGLAGGAVWTWWAAWSLVAIAMQGITPAVWAVAVVRHFSVRRGMALGITTAGVGLANLAMPLLAAPVLENLGWRWVYFLLAAFSLLVLVPLIAITLKPRVLAPSMAASPGRSGDLTPAPVAAGVTLGEAARTTLFWRLLLSVTLVAATIGFLNLHMQEIMRDRGQTAMAAAAVASLYGPAQILGRLGAGYLLDRISGPLIAGVMFLTPIIGCALLLSGSTSGIAMFLPPLLAGLAAGVEIDVMAYMTSRFFGVRHYGLIYGVLFGTFSIALGLGPLLVGALRDTYGSYDLPLIVAICVLPIASLAAFSLGRYRF